jgi:hypothetical protein
MIASTQPKQGPARFWLEREFDLPKALGTVAFVMLNPSTADDTTNDPTIRRCIAFAKSWGYRSLIVVNTNPMRSTNPKHTPEPTEFDLRDNDEALRRAAFYANKIVCAWGSHVNREFEARALEVLGRYTLHYLGLTKRGHPRHPLYLPKDLVPTLWER